MDDSHLEGEKLIWHVSTKLTSTYNRAANFAKFFHIQTGFRQHENKNPTVNMPC